MKMAFGIHLKQSNDEINFYHKFPEELTQDGHTEKKASGGSSENNSGCENGKRSISDYLYKSCARMIYLY